MVEGELGVGKVSPYLWPKRLKPVLHYIHRHHPMFLGNLIQANLAVTDHERRKVLPIFDPTVHDAFGQAWILHPPHVRPNWPGFVLTSCRPIWPATQSLAI
jgi:hypothetical protein